MRALATVFFILAVTMLGADLLYHTSEPAKFGWPTGFAAMFAIAGTVLFIKSKTKAPLTKDNG